MFEKILIVDDDVEIRDKFYEILTSLGYKVTCVPLAKEALLRLTEEKPDFILLDENMPQLGGLDAAKKIREFDRDVKIAVLYDNEPIEDEARVIKDLGIQATFKKDFSTHFMMKNILEILKEETLKPKQACLNKTEKPILVVDDNPEIRSVLLTFLSKRGYKVSDASSGEEAIMHIKTEKQKPKVVFLDVRMPGMDGIMVLKKVKEIDESIKVVMLTSAQEKEITQEARKLGACDYLIKPCDLQKLEALLLSLFTVK